MQSRKRKEITATPSQNSIINDFPTSSIFIRLAASPASKQSKIDLITLQICPEENILPATIVKEADSPLTIHRHCKGESFPCRLQSSNKRSGSDRDPDSLLPGSAAKLKGECNAKCRHRGGLRGNSCICHTRALRIAQRIASSI